jgi:hypothetical protein
VRQSSRPAPDFRGSDVLLVRESAGGRWASGCSVRARM